MECLKITLHTARQHASKLKQIKTQISTSLFINYQHNTLI